MPALIAQLMINTSRSIAASGIICVATREHDRQARTAVHPVVCLGVEAKSAGAAVVLRSGDS